MGPLPSKELAAIGRTKAERFARSFVGEVLDVLVEERSASGRAEGWSDNYLRVEVRPDEPSVAVNDMVRVTIEAFSGGRRLRGRALTSD